MLCISWNINGLKAWYNKGGLNDIMRFHPSILCLQETKCNDENFEYWTSDYEEDYLRFHNMSHFKNGYAGVGILLHKDYEKYLVGNKLIKLEDTYGDGRIIELEFTDFYYVGVYTLNSGNKDKLRITWDNLFLEYIKGLTKPVIIQGDLNVVPSDKDYWGNYEYSLDSGPGLMKFELDGFNRLCSECNLYDYFRTLHPLEEKYSWFSYMGNAFDDNKGWRLDITLGSKSLLSRVKLVDILDTLRYSDHCPIVLQLV